MIEFNNTKERWFDLNKGEIPNPGKDLVCLTPNNIEYPGSLEIMKNLGCTKWRYIDPKYPTPPTEKD